MNLGALLESLDSAVASPNTASKAVAAEGGQSFSELLGLEQGGLFNASVSLEALHTQSLLPLEQGATSSASLNDLLLKLGDALEGLDDAALLALTQLIFSLESKGPVGIRVESAGTKSAALPAEAEQFWGQLLQFLAQKNLPQLPKVDGSISAMGRNEADLKKWLQNWLSLAESSKVEEEGDEALAIVPLMLSDNASEITTPELVASANSKSSADLAMAQGKTLLQESITLTEAMAPPEPKIINPKEASIDLTASRKSSLVDIPAEKAMVQAEQVASPSEPSEEVQKAEALPKATSGGSSAVVVISEKADRLRSRVLQILAKRFAQEKTSVASSALKELGGESWQKLKDWLKSSAKTATDSVGAVPQNTTTKALEFLQFVSQFRRGTVETAQSQNNQETPDEDLTGAKVQAKSAGISRDKPTVPLLPTVSLPKSLPLGKAFGQTPQNFAVTAELLSSDHPEARLQSSTVVQTQEVRAEVASSPTALPLDSGDIRSTLNSPASVSQIHRADDAIFQKFLEHSKAQLKMWVDRKLVAMQIQMEPAEFGKMQMKTVLENGRIGVLFQVENAMAKTMLLQESQALKNVLEAQGLEIAGFYVEVWQGDRQQGQNFSSKTGTGPEFDMAKLLDGDDSSAEGLPPTKRSLIDSVA